MTSPRAEVVRRHLLLLLVAVLVGIGMLMATAPHAGDTSTTVDPGPTVTAATAGPATLYQP